MQCPSCEHEAPVASFGEPLRCPDCGAYYEKALELKLRRDGGNRPIPAGASLRPSSDSVPCVACGQLIGRKALRGCYHCGAPQTKRLSPWVFGAAVVGTALIVWVASIVSGGVSPVAPTASSGNAPAPAPEVNVGHGVPPIRASEVIMIPEDYRSDVAQMLTLLRARVPTCAEQLKPEYAGMASQQPDRSNPAFFVQCGKGVPEIVRFTWMDAVNKRVPAQADSRESIRETDAEKLCTEAAVQRSTNPDSVQFSKVWDSAFHANTDGTSLYKSTFTAAGNAGVRQKFDIACSYQGLRLTRVEVTPSR